MGDDPAQENLRCLYDWLNKVRALVNQDEQLAKEFDIQSSGDADKFLQVHPEYDDLLSGYLESSGYLEFYTIEARNNPYRYRVDLFFGALSMAEDEEEFVGEELSKEVRIFRRFTIMQHYYAGLFKKTNLNFFRLQLRLYHNMVSEILIRTLVVRDALVLNGNTEAAESLDDTIQIVKLAVRDGQEALKSGT